MPRFTAKNHVTGETVSFDWQGDDPPTETDVARISDQQRQSRIKVKQEAADREKQSFTDRLMSSPASDYAMRAANALGLNQPWHPLDAASEIGSGVKQMFTGSGPEANPRTAGAAKALHGVMGEVGPPLTALGYATAPIPMAAGMLVGNTAAEGTRRGIESIAPDTSPEVKDLASTGVGLVAGGLAGHGISRVMRPNAASSGPIKPASTELQAPRKVYGRWETTGGDNTGTVVNFGPRALPPGNVEAPAPRPFVGPRPQLESGAPPNQVPDFAYGDRSTLSAAPPQAQLPERGQPIEMPPPPIQAPPAGTHATAEAISPAGPPQIQGSQYGAPQLTSGAHQMPPAGTEAMRGQFDAYNSRPVMPQSRQLEAPKDLVSQQRPDPLSPSEVATVDRSPGEQTAAAAPAPMPPEPEEPVQPKFIPSAPPTPPPSPATPPTPTAQPAPAPQPPVSTPQAPQLAPQPVPPPQVQAPIPPATPATSAKPTVDVAKLMAELNKARAENTKLKAVPPPAPQVAQAAPVQAPVAPVPPPTQGPMDIARAAMSRIPNVKAPGEPTEEPMLAPQEVAKAKTNNDVVDFLKRRQNVTIDQIQRQFGMPADQVRTMIGGLQKRGLIQSKAGKINYIKMPGEEIESPPTNPAPPESSTPEATPQTELSPYRKQRLSDLQQQIGQAEDEGDTTAADVLRDHLQSEEGFAKIEQGSNPEAKRSLNALDLLYDRINKLESKENESELSDKENLELAGLYKNANRLETIIETFLRSEHGQQGGEQEGPQRGFFARRLFVKNGSLPAEGRAVPTDPSNFETEMGSPNQTLARSGIPGAVQIGTRTPEVEVLKQKFVGTMLRRGAEIHKGLSKAESVQVGTVLDQYQDPSQAKGYSPKVIKAANKTRDLLDEVFRMFPQGAKRSGGDVGYLQGYLSHMKKEFGSSTEFGDFLNDALKYHLAPFKAGINLLSSKPVESLKPGGTNIGESATGRPRSPFVEERKDQMQDYEKDIRKVFPAYVEASGKVIYDKPWIDQAQKYLAMIPDDAPHAQALAKSYLRNYARYDSLAGLENDWNGFTGKIMRMHARAVLGLSTRLLGLHAGRLMNTIYPEIPDNYMLQGIKAVAQDPLRAYDEAGRRGLLPANTRPWLYKKPMEKYQSILNFGSVADYLPDAIGWNALNSMYKDNGFSASEAGNMATNRVMDLSMRVTPARIAHLFTRGGPLRPFTQYKQQVFKIAEQYTRAGNDIVKQRQYGRALKYIIGVGASIVLTRKAKMHLFHLNPLRLGQMGAGAYDAFINPKSGFIAKVARGEVGPALKDFGLYVTGLKNPLKEIEQPSIFTGDSPSN